MPTIVCGLSSLMVAGIFYSWRSYQDLVAQKHRQLRERVAYMLWVMAKTITK
jgi:hypothetical protein